MTDFHRSRTQQNSKAKENKCHRSEKPQNAPRGNRIPLLFNADGWKAERCRTASWRNFQFLGIIFFRGFHPCHIGTLDFCTVPRWIFWLKFLEAVFRGIYCSYCRKTHNENSGKNSVEKFGENIPFFGAIFWCVFRYVFRCFFRWVTFCLEMGKIRAESVLQERPFNRWSTPKTQQKLHNESDTWTRWIFGRTWHNELTLEHSGKKTPEQELWEGARLKPYHFNCTIGPFRITQLIPREFSGVAEVKCITPINSLRILGVISGVLPPKRGTTRRCKFSWELRFLVFLAVQLLR